MARHMRLFYGLGALLVVVAILWVVLSFANLSVPNDDRQSRAILGSGLLDGMTFVSKLGPVDQPADVEDKLTFADGTFVSKECDRRCGYPPASYFVRRVKDKVEFVSESRCLRKDATLVWRGTVENGFIRGRLSWKASRWYWTIEKEFWFEGKLIKTADPFADPR